jgi:site-specific recombinase XerD
MMIAAAYLSRSRVFRRLKSGSHGQLIERYAAHLAEEGLAQEGAVRCLTLVGDLMKWIASSGSKMADIDERMVERYLRNRASNQSIHPIVRPALKRFLSVLRNVGMIAPAEPPRITQQDEILAEFSDYQQRERGLAPRSIVTHLPVIRRFLCEVCPADAVDLGKIDHADVVHYVERHARDGSPDSAKLMCWSLRAFLRYLHHKGLNRVPLAGCVPSIRQWKFANLPTYLSAEQVQKVLDGCDRSSALERRDYAILMMLAKLGLRANESRPLHWMISTGDPVRCSFAPRAGSEHGCRSHRTSAQLSSPTCVVLAPSLRVADCFSAHALPASALHPLLRSPRSPRPRSSVLASGASLTKGRISSGTA